MGYLSCSSIRISNDNKLSILTATEPQYEVQIRMNTMNGKVDCGADGVVSFFANFADTKIPKYKI
jgi:hypothetical protein